MNWQDCQRILCLSSDQCDRIVLLVGEFKNQIVEIVCAPSDQGGLSPLRKLARYMSRVAKHDDDCQQHFRGLLEEAVEGVSYADRIGKRSEQTNQDIMALLSQSQRETAQKMGWDDFCNLPIHEDPIGKRLGEYMAGLGDVFAAPSVPATEESTEYAGLFCPQPFRYAQTDPLGELYLCCPQTLPKSAGNLGENSLMELWNGDTARDIRGAILDGSFRYCSAETCGALQSRRLPRADQVTNPELRAIIDEGRTELSHGPHVINMSHDRSCNLACPSCRSELIILAGHARERARAIHDAVLGEHLQDAKELIITGSGDPFGSHLYLSFLRMFEAAEHPGLRIQLSTNGLLLDSEMWESICSESVYGIDVSIDAASQPTYKLNRGGDFERLLDNLRFISKLRETGEIHRFQIHFVVQENNFREMPRFFEMGRELKCDAIVFKQLLNWGTYTEAEYQSRAVQLAGHSLHTELLQVLNRLPIDDPTLYLHDLMHLRHSQ